jgi:hypothetical protein
VTSTQEDLRTRLDRLERDFSSEVSASMRARGHGDSALNRISLLAWLQISGPTFATLLFGFTLLWNAQEAQIGSLLEVPRSAGRLEGWIHGLDARIGQLDARIERLDARIDKLGDAIDTLAKRVGSS